MRRSTLCFAFLVLSCGGKSGHSDPPVTPNNTTETPIVNQQDLPETSVKELQTWLRQPKKSCSVHAIFSSITPKEDSIAESYDLNLLLKALDHKLWLTNKAGDTLLFTKPFGPKSSGFTEASQNRNGSKIVFKSELTSAGLCTITVNDKTLATVPLTSGFGVAALLKKGGAIKFDSSETSQFNDFDTEKGHFASINGLHNLAETFQFDANKHLAAFDIPNYDLQDLILKTYRFSPDSISFETAQGSYQGFLATFGAFDDYLPRLKPSWVDAYATTFSVVPTILDNKDLEKLRKDASPIPVQWNLEFSAWAADKTTGQWIPQQAKVQVKGAVTSFKTDNFSGLPVVGISLKAIANPVFVAAAADQVSGCLVEQAAFAFDALKAGFIINPDAAIFPCERLAGAEPTVAVGDVYVANDKVRSAINKILAALPLDTNSSLWQNFDLHLAKKIGKAAFPFSADGPFLRNWKIYFDLLTNEQHYPFDQAITLSSNIIHAHSCKTRFSDAAVVTFAQEYSATFNSNERRRALEKLQASCP